MRWPIRKAKIPNELRDIFDRYGETVVATVVAGGFIPDAPDLRAVFHNAANNAHARDWLTERGNISEWRTTRDFLLEIVIIVLIGVEIVLGARGLRDGKEQAKILADMNANIATTAATLGTLQETQKNALDALRTSNEELTALADVRLSFIRTAPALRVQGRNLSSLRPATNVYCDTWVWNLNQLQVIQMSFSQLRQNLGNLGPGANSGLGIVVDYLGNHAPGSYVLAYVTVSCPECAHERAYWALLTVGQRDGNFIETKPLDPSALPQDDLKRKVEELKKQKGQPIIFQTN
jgi:hypothetical protein